ncbi:MAG: molybdopterin-dependent oxidoreductase [Coriobacteriales bacterium]|jgi:CO/xanthine dehydrogenase Mo-binding subunit/aerobic-type carbon monoxide dehydrogenase small subunit (CoxS/CutS family)|nr:molybdopterin-dependent oxidoreductase [Coriobacteriales bacterium]
MKITINNRLYDIPAGKSLLRYLRDDLHITSVKDGCSSGACGTCTVLINGQATKSCIRMTENLEGAEVVTIEGLTQHERDVYVESFAAAGAVQCGFCIPGMVIAAKALLDVERKPTREQIKKAINGNICRCTGYLKIEEAIILAAEYFRGERQLPAPARHAGISDDVKRPDAAEKVLGTGIFGDDIYREGMVFAKALRAPAPRALIHSINTAAAEHHPDCVRILTAADVPHNKHGHLRRDWDVMIAAGHETRYIGDAIALVASEREESLDEILALIKVDFEVLEPVTSATDALRADAPLIHSGGNIMSKESLRRGDVDKAIAESAFCITRKYHTPHNDHAFMEPEVALAVPIKIAPLEEDGAAAVAAAVAGAGGVAAAPAAGSAVAGVGGAGGAAAPTAGTSVVSASAATTATTAAAPAASLDGLHLYTGAQSVYDDRREVATMLGIDLERVRVTSNLVGGGFGGKEDMSVQHHAALMAWHTKRPVKVKFSRQESINYHTKRHAMDMEFTTACDAEGRLTAMRALLVADTGAYASLGGPVLQRACTHAAGPYKIANVDILGLAVYTNNVVSGAYRGFGVTQSCFAMEGNLNELAELVGISPWEIRYRNAIRPGEALANGQIADPSTAMVETLEAVREVFESSPYAGIACGFKNSGKGIGLVDTGRCLLSVEDGKVHLRTSAACMGQGIAAVCMHMVCETTGLAPADLVFEAPDTVRTPDSGTSTASRQTLITGEAAHRAAQQLAEALRESGASLASLEGREFYGEFSPVTDPMGAPVPNPVSHVSYSYATQVVVLDEQGKLEKVVAAYDVGVPVNPRSCEGQIEGGIVMGLGFALTEDFPLAGGYPKVKYGTLGLMRATQVPPLEVHFTAVERERLLPYAYGAKGVGELCLIPTSPAAAHAYYRLDGIHRRSLPLRGTYYKK